MQKARRHPRSSSEDGNRAPTACMHTVSGSISLAVRRSFHLSLTVLSAIGHRLVFSLGRWSSRIQPGFHVSRPTRGSAPACLLAFRIRDSHPLRSYVPVPFRYASARLAARPHNPRTSHPVRVWAVPFSLAATLGISIDFLSSRYLDVSVPWVGSLERVTGSLPPGCPIRTSPDLSLLAAPRGFSQLATSFVAGLCQGIRRVHFLA